MTNSVITMVQAIKADYGTVNCKEASNDPRLKALQKRFSDPVGHPKKVYKSDRLRKAQRLLDNTSLPKYKIAEGTINQIAMKLGKSPSTIRGCTLSSYKKYSHIKTYKLVKVR